MAVQVPARGRRLTPAARRAQILDAAMQTFAGRDPASVTYEEIADQAGVSRALLYNYFPDRGALFDELSARNGRQLRDEVREALASVHGRRDALAEAIRVHLLFAQRDHDAYASATGGPQAAIVNPAEAELVAEICEIFGSGPEAQIAATGLTHAIRSMTLAWAADPTLDIERVDQLITTMIAGAIISLDNLGLHLHPTWHVPDPSSSQMIAAAGN
jgi:AcrR family transcriptional regulator